MTLLSPAYSFKLFKIWSSRVPLAHWKANVDGRADRLAEVTSLTLFKEIP